VIEMAVILYSRESREELLRAIKEARNNELDKSFRLTIAGIDDGDEDEINFVPMDVRERRGPQLLADGRTVVLCINRYGREIDIYLPPAEEQLTRMPEVLIEEDDIQIGS